MKRFKGNKLKWKWVIIPVCIFVGVWIGKMVYEVMPAGERFHPHRQSITNETEESEGNSDSYITETCYDGSYVLPEYVFQFPFQRTEYYISNKNYIELVPESRIESLTERADEFFHALFQNSREIAKDYETYEKTLANFFSKDASYITDDKFSETATQFLSNLAKAVYDSGLQAEVSYDTDKSLVWQDMCHMIRGIVTINVITIKDADKLKEYFNIPLENGKKYEILWDISFINGEDSRSISSSIISEMEILYTKGEER